MVDFIMRSLGRERAFSCGGMVLATLLAAAMTRQDGGAAFDTTGYPADMVAAARLTTQRCSKCHALNRVVNAAVKGAAWDEVVDRMARKEKSGISTKDAAAIGKFLAFRSQQGQAGSSRPTDPPKSADLGGPAVYQAPQYAAFDTATVSIADALPIDVVLGDLHCVIETVTVATAEGGQVTVIAHVRCGNEQGEITLGRDADDESLMTMLPVRSWSIGPHHLSLAVAIYSANAPFVAGQRPLLKLASIVVRD